MTSTDPDLVDELGNAPVANASKVISAATATRPSLSVPLMPPPTGLCDGERRAPDGGVEPAPPAEPDADQRAEQ